MRNRSIEEHSTLLEFLKEVIRRFPPFDQQQIARYLSGFQPSNSTGALIDPLIGINANEGSKQVWEDKVTGLLIQLAALVASKGLRANVHVAAMKGVNQALQGGAIISDKKMLNTVFNGDSIDIPVDTNTSLKLVASPSDLPLLEDGLKRGIISSGSKLHTIYNDLKTVSANLTSALASDEKLHIQLRMVLRFFDDYINHLVSKDKVGIDGFYTYLLNHELSFDPMFPLYLKDDERKQLQDKLNLAGDVTVFMPNHLKGDPDMSFQGWVAIVVAVIQGVAALVPYFHKYFTDKKKDAMKEAQASVMMDSGVSADVALSKTSTLYDEAMEQERIWLRTTVEGSRVAEWADKYFLRMMEKVITPQHGSDLTRMTLDAIKKHIPALYTKYLSKCQPSKDSYPDKIADFKHMTDLKSGPATLVQWAYSAKMLGTLPSAAEMLQLAKDKQWINVKTDFTNGFINLTKALNDQVAVLTNDSVKFAKRMQAYPGVYWNTIAPIVGEFTPDVPGWTDNFFTAVAKQFTNLNPISESNENSVIPNNNGNVVNPNEVGKDVVNPIVTGSQDVELIVTPQGSFVKTSSQPSDHFDLIALGRAHREAREGLGGFYPNNFVSGDPSYFQGFLPVAGLALKAAGAIGKKLIGKIKEKIAGKVNPGTDTGSASINNPNTQAGLSLLNKPESEGILPNVHATGLWASDQQFAKDEIKALVDKVKALKDDAKTDSTKLNQIMDKLSDIAMQLNGIDIKISLGSPNIMTLGKRLDSGSSYGRKNYSFIGDFATELGSIVLRNSSSVSDEEDENDLATAKAEDDDE